MKARLVYCDYIAAIIKQELKRVCDAAGLIVEVGPTELDLDPRDGYMLSHKKTLIVEGANGQRYRVTVEDIE